MDVEKILEQLKAEPAKLAKLADAVKSGDIENALKEHGIDLEPEKLAELGKKLAAEGGDLGKKLKEEGGDLLEKGEALLGSLFGDKK